MMTVPHRQRRRRRHGAADQVGHHDRRQLELAGWRTLLEYRENLVRDRDGTLVAVVPQWTAEAERQQPPSARQRPETAVVVAATADAPGAVWAALRAQIERLPQPSRVRARPAGAVHTGGS